MTPFMIRSPVPCHRQAFPRRKIPAKSATTAASRRAHETAKKMTSPTIPLPAVLLQVSRPRPSLAN